MLAETPGLGPAPTEPAATAGRVATVTVARGAT